MARDMGVEAIMDRMHQQIDEFFENGGEDYGAVEGEEETVDDDGEEEEIDDDCMPTLESNNAQELEKELQEDGTCCAICFEPTTRNNPLIVLPCCGTNAQGTASEHASSTRFCGACIGKCLSKNYTAHTWMGFWWLGECPRCKHLLLQHKYNDSSLQKAGVEEQFWYAYNREFGEYRYFLVAMAWCAPGFIPSTILEWHCQPDLLDHLAQWGLLQKKSKEVYSMDSSRQRELRALVEEFLSVDADGEIVGKDEGHENVQLNRSKLLFLSAIQLLAASYQVGWHERAFVRALRMAYRALLLSMVASRLLPNFDDWKNEREASLLALVIMVWIIFHLMRLAVKMFWIAVYVAGVSYTLGLWMQRLPAATTPRWKRWARTGSVGLVGVGVVYYGLKIVGYWRE